jgi:hypothetical protein
MSAGTPAAPVPEVKPLNCPGCGAALTVRAGELTLTVVCENCHSILDAKDPNLQILQKFEAKVRIKPLIPLGTRGKIRGDVYEAIGFQERTIYVEELPYSWREYLLFNPFKGFRYLTEYDGHWNYVTTLKALPQPATVSGRPGAAYLGEKYAEFQSAAAKTTYVLGEFPWQVRVGEEVQVRDFVNPPRMLSSETTESETTWSLGEYITGASIWGSFKLPGAPPRPIGVYENQPSPYSGNTKQAWALCAFFLLTLGVIALAFATFQAQHEVFHGSYRFPYGEEPSFVTGVFELDGRPSNVEIAVSTDLDNNWAYFNYALIDQDTGQAYDFGREVSYFHGRDSDGNWTEGSRHDSAILPTVPAGHYYLRVEPEMAMKSLSMSYDLTIRRDVPVWTFFWIAAVLLIVPPAFIGWRGMQYEHLRWQESDHPPGKGGGG